MPGPPPQPTNLRNFRGNPGRRPLPSHEPRPEVAEPECPRWLDAEAKRMWAFVAPRLLAVKCIAEMDLSALAGYCAVWSRWVKATKDVQRRGIVIRPKPTKKQPGIARVNPSVTVAAEAERILSIKEAKLGLSPSDRCRITVPDDGQREDPAKKILGF